MDPDRYDALSRLAGASGSRRGTLSALAGAVLLLARGSQTADARCQSKEGKNKRQCRRRRRDDAPRGGTCGLAGQLCGDLLGVECCGPFKCTTTAAVISNCVLPCTTDAQCEKQFIYDQVSCKSDLLSCPFIAGGKCCVAQGCLSNGDCKSPFTCQGGACKR